MISRRSACGAQLMNSRQDVRMGLVEIIVTVRGPTCDKMLISVFCTARLHVQSDKSDSTIQLGIQAAPHCVPSCR